MVLFDARTPIRQVHYPW